MKSQTPSTKLQTNLKFQYSMTKTQNRFGISNFGHCDLFDICYLLFGISMPQHSKKIHNLFLEVPPTEIPLYTFTTWLPGKNHFSTRKRNPTHMPLSYRAEQDG